MKRNFSNFGFSTIFISFVMICIVTFSALSLLTANSDYKLSQKAADKTMNYYEAEASAYQTLAEIDRLLSQSYDSVTGQSLYYEKAAEALLSYQKKHSDIRLTKTEEEPCVTFEVPISENQRLAVSIGICYPPNSGGVFYQLTGWQTVTDITQDNEKTLHLIGNE